MQRGGRLAIALLVLAVLCSAIACSGEPRTAKPSPPLVTEYPADSGVNTKTDAALPAFVPSVDCVHAPVAAMCKAGMCPIPAGCFVLGVARDKRSATAASNREVEVRLTHAFEIGQTEVTRKEWLAAGLPEPAIDWRVTGSASKDVPPAGYASCTEPECPMVWLSFEDAAAYANQRSESEGLKPCYVLDGCIRNPGENMRCASVRVDAASVYECIGYRLPTEPEWEYAARAGTRTDYYSGDMAPDPAVDTDCGLDPNLDRIGWYCGNSGGPRGQVGAGRAQAVAQKQPNAFGLYDISGNAYEWTNDVYTPDGYGEGPLVDPVSGLRDAADLTPDEHPNYGAAKAPDGFFGFRVRRGGSFDFWSALAASSRRHYAFEASQNSGLRLVRTLPAPSTSEAR